MGRDMTPRDLHKASIQLPGLSRQKITMEHDGKSEVISDPDSPLAKAYPNLYFLFGPENMKRIKRHVLEAFERDLTHVINADDAGRKVPQESDRTKLISEWYAGKLDPHFYYNTRNHEILREAMEKEGKNGGTPHGTGK